MPWMDTLSMLSRTGPPLVVAAAAGHTAASGTRLLPRAEWGAERGKVPLCASETCTKPPNVGGQHFRNSHLARWRVSASIDAALGLRSLNGSVPNRNGHSAQPTMWQRATSAEFPPVQSRHFARMAFPLLTLAKPA